MLYKTLTVLLTACIALSMNLGGVSLTHAAPFQSADYQTGFPRTEPGTIDFAGPTVVDLNADGRMEILVADSGGCVWGWDAAGNTLANFPLRPSGACGSRNRINSLAVGNIDSDAAPEIVIGAAGAGESAGQRGKVYAYNANGSLVSGWPKEMAWNSAYATGQPEIYTVALANVSAGPELEVLAGTSNNTSSGGSDTDTALNLYAWYGSGAVLKGFPTGYRRGGIYGLIGAGDLNNDACMEVLTPRDHRWLHAYNSAGEYPAGWPIETFVDPTRTSAAPYVEFTRNAPVVGDLNGDGRVEVVAAGRVKQSEAVTGGATVILNSGVMVFEPDGARMAGWSLARLADGPPLVDSYSPSQAPALADINNDGLLEVIVTLMDGTARAYRANGDLLWKYNFAAGRKLFASEPVVGDINGDGRVEIIFGTYAPDGSANASVGLVALSHTGALLSGYPLPLTLDTGEKRGIRSAPALADLDGDGDVEIVAGTWSGVVYVWDLPGRYNPALMPWPTARHDNTRSGFYPRSGGPRLNSMEFSEDGQYSPDAYPAPQDVGLAPDLNAPAIVNLAAATFRLFIPSVSKPAETVPARSCP